MPRLLNNLLYLALVLLLLSACQTAAPSESLSFTAGNFRYVDLRAIDPPGEIDPALDIAAVYMRRQNQSLTIRIDLLEVTPQAIPDLYLLIDYVPGGGGAVPFDSAAFLDEPGALAWDALVYLPAQGEITLIDPAGQRIPGYITLLRDPRLDALSLRLPARFYHPNIKIQVFSAAPAGRRVADTTGIISFADPPPAPGKLLLAFWNTFPAYTPAQVVRRWDGAHSGPLGGRHGLYNLLRSANSHAIPLALLDLRHPATLPGLDYTGRLDFVERLLASGLVSTAVVEPDEDKTQTAFALAGSALVYFPAGNPSTRAGRVALYHSDNDRPLSRIYQIGSGRVLPLPAEIPAAFQPGAEGFELATRRLLLAHAASADSSILVLGGDLSASAFGAAEPARAAFQYLDGHPWLDVLAAPELLSEPIDTKSAAPAALHSEPIFQPTTALAARLDAAPGNALTLAARQATWRLKAPLAASPPEALPELADIRRIYATQLELLLDAARWAANPVAMRACTQDYDRDGFPECVWSDGSYFAAWHGRSGALTHLFVLLPDGSHQLVGPSFQMIAAQGLADEWDLSAGWLADPQAIPGGFALAGSAPQIDFYPNGASLRNEHGQVDYFFAAERFTIRLQADALREQVLPLLLDPWLLEAPGSSEYYPATNENCRWGIKNTFSLLVSTSLPCRLEAFTITRARMGELENPNLELPAAHYLPLPLAVLHFAPGSDPIEEIQFTIQPMFPGDES